jgi:hypothetical protein
MLLELFGDLIDAAVEMRPQILAQGLECKSCAVEETGGLDLGQREHSNVVFSEVCS